MTAKKTTIEKVDKKKIINDFKSDLIDKIKDMKNGNMSKAQLINLIKAS